MSENKKNEKAISIITIDPRRISFYKKYMNKRQCYFIPSDSNGYCESINEAISRHFPITKDRNNFINNMLNSYNDNVIQKNEFEWIKVNDRNCYWVWLMVRKIIYMEQKDEDNAVVNSPPIYEIINLPLSPSSTNERYNAIISFFDVVDKDISIKRDFLSVLKEGLHHIYHYSRSFNWLRKENENQCEWALNYVKDRSVNMFNPYIYPPIGKEEIYLAIMASFDAWPASHAEKELFLIKIKKAWSQKKYRDEISDKKLLNTYISQDAKKKLDKLTKDSKKKINEMIEDLINKEYEKL